MLLETHYYSSGRHCDGPASSTVEAATASSIIASVTESSATGSVTASSTVSVVTSSSTSDHDEDHEEGSATLAPSPTESVGCEAHGDHWHCDGPASTTSSEAAAETGGAGNLRMGSAALVGGLLAAAGMGL